MAKDTRASLSSLRVRSSMQRRAMGTLLAVCIFFLLGGIAVPPAFAALPIQTYWSGSAIVGNADCPFQAWMEVNWEISWSPSTDLFSWAWTTSTYWPSICGDTANGAVDLLQGVLPTSPSSAGSGASAYPPNFTVAPLSIAIYASVGLPDGSPQPTVMTMQPVAWIET